jgi:hypothetical protein
VEDGACPFGGIHKEIAAEMALLWILLVASIIPLAQIQNALVIDGHCPRTPLPPWLRRWRRQFM